MDHGTTHPPEVGPGVLWARAAPLAAEAALAAGLAADPEALLAAEQTADPEAEMGMRRAFPLPSLGDRG